MDNLTAIIIGLPPVIYALLNAARAIVRLTPAKEDDIFLAKNESKIMKVLDVITKLGAAVPDNKKSK